MNSRDNTDDPPNMVDDTNFFTVASSNIHSIIETPRIGNVNTMTPMHIRSMQRRVSVSQTANECDFFDYQQ